MKKKLYIKYIFLEKKKKKKSEREMDMGRLETEGISIYLCLYRSRKEILIKNYKIP